MNRHRDCSWYRTQCREYKCRNMRWLMQARRGEVYQLRHNIVRLSPLLRSPSPFRQMWAPGDQSLPPPRNLSIIEASPSAKAWCPVFSRAFWSLFTCKESVGCNGTYLVTFPHVVFPLSRLQSSTKHHPVTLSPWPPILPSTLTICCPVIPPPVWSKCYTWVHKCKNNIPLVL